MPKTKILCIEDEPQAVHLLRLILEERDYHVVVAKGGRAGLEAMRIEKPDLIVLDLILADMDGEDVYQHIKHYDERSEIPVIVVTANAAPIDKALWVHIAGVDDYITKPFGSSELLGSIERVLARRQTCGSGSV